MKKRVSTLLAVAALVGAASAFAANPFSDVPKDSWAYQAVTQLASEGIVVGYPNGTFQGEKNITRYEMAEIIARMMANEDRANAEQRAVINKLAQEFATELNNLGVRVGALENKVGNVKLTGDARLKYERGAKSEGNKDWTTRVRLQATGAVAENTTAGARLVMNTAFGEGDQTKVEFDRLWVKHNFGSVAVTAGRQSAVLGEGLVADLKLDGVVAAAPLGNATVVAGYGYPINAVAYGEGADKAKYTVSFGQVGVDLANVGLKAYYAKANKLHMNVYGVSATTKLGDFGFGAEWSKHNESKSNTWVVGADYQAGPANLMLQYFYAQPNAVALNTTWDQGDEKTNNWKGFVATAQVDVAKNMDLKVAYSFKGKAVEGKRDLHNTYFAELNYKF